VSQPTNTPAPQQTRDQQRAKHAMQVVDSVVKKLPPDKAKKFGGQARRMPSRIVASGLGQALVFLKAKAGKADGPPPELLVAIGDWVLNRPADGFNPARGLPADDALLKAVIDGSADDLRRLTDEALVYLQWLTRFCEANTLTDDAESSHG
jgi:CRISPR-associated protein Cmr5